MPASATRPQQPETLKHGSGQTGEALRIAVADGLRAAVRVVAVSIAATILVAPNLRATNTQPPVPGSDG